MNRTDGIERNFHVHEQSKHKNDTLHKSIKISFLIHSYKKEIRLYNYNHAIF